MCKSFMIAQWCHIISLFEILAPWKNLGGRFSSTERGNVKVGSRWFILSDFTKFCRYRDFFFFNRHYNPGWVSDRSTIVEHSQQEGFYRAPLPAAHQTPILEENQWFRAFQLSPQEVPSVWSDASEPSSGRWNYGREMAEKFYRKWRLPRNF
jgi:hypothetical protein